MKMANALLLILMFVTATQSNRVDNKISLDFDEESDEELKREVDRKKMLKLTNLLAKGFFNFKPANDELMNDLSVRERMTLADEKNRDETWEASNEEGLPPFLMKMRDMHDSAKGGSSFLRKLREDAKDSENDMPPILLNENDEQYRLLDNDSPFLWKSNDVSEKSKKKMPPFILEQPADQSDNDSPIEFFSAPRSDSYDNADKKPLGKWIG